MRDLTPEETAAQWFYGAEYARSGMGAIDWWARTQASNPSRERFIRDFVDAMRKAIARAA